MIVTCPSCETKYRVEASALAARGGKVRCASCSHVWTVEDDALTLEQPVTPAPQPASPASEPEPKAPHAVIRQRAEARRRQTQKATEGVAWAGVAALFIAVLGGAAVFRVDVVQAFPRTAPAFAAVGLAVNPHGLEVRDLVIERAVHDGTPVLIVDGSVHNITGRERDLRPLRASLLDAEGATLVEWTVILDGLSLASGGEEHFQTILPDPPARATEIEIVLAPDALTGGAEIGHGPAAAHAAPSAHSDDARASSPSHAGGH